MKKIIILLLCSVFITESFGQQNSKELIDHMQNDLKKLEKTTEKKHTPYVAVFSSKPFGGKYAALCLEAGSWGTVSKHTFAISASFDNSDSYLGLKYYYTIFDLKFISAMAYVNPQMRISHHPLFIMEEGAGLNAKMGKHFLLGYYLGIQNSADDGFVPVHSVGLTLLK